MAGETIQISGLEDASRALRELPQKMRRAMLRKALRDAGAIIRDDAKARAPVLEKKVPYRIRGLLRRTITVRASFLARKRGDLGVYVTVRRLSKKQIAAGKEKGFGVGRNPRDPFYFRFLEEGTKKMSARSFIGPALAAKSDSAVTSFSRTVQAGIAIENTRR